MSATRYRYRYNPETCRYEPYFVTGKALRKRVFIFLSISFALALAGFFWQFGRFDSFQEYKLKERHEALTMEWDILQDRIRNANQQLAALIEKDDNNYRVILDSSPLDSSIRVAGIGGSERINLRPLREFPLILNQYVTVEKLKHQLNIEVQSYNEIEEMLNEKLAMWASRPAIQPVSNTDLIRLHTTYGARYHPLLGYVRDHKGLDFSAPPGKPVYATGDGIVKVVYYSRSYGRVVFIDHQYGFETRYAHLSAFNVTKGQRVKRGEIIGYVGNTGLSRGPHLHYEVLYKGKHINPINFFQRDLSNEEYEKLIEEGSKHTDPLD